MSRAGRKRKSGPRHPGGQLKKDDKDPGDRVRTSRQPHRRALAHELRAAGVEDLDVKKAAAGEEAESPIGRLWLSGFLASKLDHDSAAARDRYDAANMYAQIVGAYRQLIGAPGSDCGGSGKSYECLDLLCALDEDTRKNCQCERLKERYDGAFEALSRLNMRSLKAVNAVAVHRQAIRQDELVYLVEGLEQLRRHLGLTARRNAKHYRNTD